VSEPDAERYAAEAAEHGDPDVVVVLGQTEHRGGHDDDTREDDADRAGSCSTRKAPLTWPRRTR
jgi:hypothetical protein